MNPRPTLFIGSSSEAKYVATAIQSNLWQDIQTTIWDQDVFSATQGTLESLVKAVNDFDFGVLVLSREDVAIIRDQKVDVVRDNVIFEAGMFIGKLGRERVFLVVPHDGVSLHLPTDLLGTTTLFYDAQRSDDNWKAATAPPCEEIKTAVKKLGGIKASKGVVAYGDSVVLTTFDGSYVHVEANEQGTLKADSKEFSKWTKFEVVSATGAIKGRSVKFGDKVGLKSLTNNRYVGVNYNENQEKLINAWVPKLNIWETFVVQPANLNYSNGDVLPYGASFALLSDENKSAGSGYVAYKPVDTQTFWAAATQIGDWERLRFVEPE